MDAVSNILTNAFSAFSPALNAAAAICSVNGQQVACPQGFDFFFPFGLVWLAIVGVMIVASWKIYVKAGQPGWASIVPVYNVIIMLQIVKKPTWWVILFFIPFVNVIIGLIVASKLAQAFGKGFGFTLGLILLPIIFYPILGFGSATYVATPAPVAAPTPEGQI